MRYTNHKFISIAHSIEHMMAEWRKGMASVILLGMSVTPLAGMSQTSIIIEPLFEYPTPPEEFEGLTERSNYLMDHFWDSFDFTRKTAVDQNALMMHSECLLRPCVMPRNQRRCRALMA